MVKLLSLLLSLFLLQIAWWTKAAENPLSLSTTAAEEPLLLSGEPMELLDVIRLTVVHSPTIRQQQRQVTIAGAQARSQAGTFDPVFYTSLENRHQRAADPPILYTRDYGDDIESQWGIKKLFREGFTTDFSVSLLRDDRSNDDFHSPAVYNKAKVYFTLTVPLLQGRGRRSVAAIEKVAHLEKEASLLNLKHFIASTLLAAIGAYWDYKASVERRVILQQSQQRILQWKEEFEQHFGEDNKAIISHWAGVLADKRRIVAGAIEEINNSKSQLALVMGIPAEQTDNLGLPAADFIEASSLTIKNYEEARRQWIAIALEKRMDLKALELLQKAAAVSLAKTKRDKWPKLDLKLSAGYKGVTDDKATQAYFDSLNSHVLGTDTTAALVFSYPLGNNAAAGAYDLSQAIYQQRREDVQELQRNIHVQIGVNIKTLERRLQEVKEAANTILAYQEAVDDLLRTAKAQLDENKIFNLIDLEEKLTEADSNHLVPLKELAKTIAQIRFQTGTLFITNTTTTTDEIEVEALTSLP